MKKISAFVPVIIAFVSIFFVACGGEECTDSECDDPIDTIVIADDNVIITDDATTPDEDLTENEPVDATDETPDDDGLIDNEPTDDDTAPLTCDQDPTCQEICKNFLDIQGKWNNIDPDDVGSVDITLAVKDAKCEIKLVGQGSLTWYGTDYPLDPIKDGYFFYLSKKEQNLLVEVKDGSGILHDWDEFSR